MAENTPIIEELQKQLKAANAKAEALEKQVSESKEEVAALRAKSGNRDHTGKPIPGEITVELEQPGGKKEKKKFKFQPGYVYCRLANGEKVGSEQLMKLATKGTLSDDEKAQYPLLAKMDKEKAYKYLADLVRKRVSFLIPA